MAQFTDFFDVDLQKPTSPQPLRQMIGEGDAKGLRVGANVTNNGAVVSLGGSCVGKVVRADGATVELTGMINGNQAYVVLDQASCAIEGPIQVAVCWVSGSNVTTLVIAYGSVVHTQTGNAIQPSTPIPDLTQLLAQIDAMQTATAAANAAANNALGNFAPAFDETIAYTVGQYVTYTNGKLYRFTADHAAGVWNSSHVTAVTVGKELDGTAVNARMAQSFTTAQKTQARGNIGAVSAAEVDSNIAGKAVLYDGAQHLSDAQKGVARGNIGALSTTALDNFAGAFSTSTAYTAGQYVTYTDGYFYRFTADHAAGAWNSAEVTQVTTGAELSGLKSQINYSLEHRLVNWEQGAIANATGQDTASSEFARTDYYEISSISSFHKPAGIQLYCFGYTANKEYIRRVGISTNVAFDGDASNLTSYFSVDAKYVRFTASITAQAATTPSNIVSSDLNIICLFDANALRSDVDSLESDVDTLNKSVFSSYTDFVQGAYSASGVPTPNSNMSRSGFIDINILDKIVSPVGWQTRLVYTMKDGTVSVVNVAYTILYTETAAYIRTKYPNVASIAAHYQHYNGSTAETTTPEMLVTLAPITISNVYKGETAYDFVNRYNPQFFSVEDKTITATTTFTVKMGSEKAKNMIISSNAMFTGDNPPTIYVTRKWQKYDGSWLTYYGSSHYIVGGNGTYKQQQWRIPGWIKGYADDVTVTITIPTGTTLYIKDMSNYYDDSITRAENDLHLNAHGFSGFGGPAQTLYQYTMAAKLGFRCCITIPKVTSDGVYVCLHDDDSIQATARNDDGSTIAAEYQNRPVSDFTYEELLQFDFGIVRGKPFAGSRIPKLEDFFTICARTGMHPMLSVHPSLSGHWANIKALAKRCGVLHNLNIKSDPTSIEVPMAVLLDDIESYTIDDSTSTSNVARFNSLKTTYNITKARCIIEYNKTAITDALIEEVLNNGYACGVFNYSAISDMLELYGKGVTEFTEDYNSSVGLNWD